MAATVTHGNPGAGTPVLSNQRQHDVALASGGYPLAIIQGEVEPKYLCALCALVLRTATQSECGHRFCLTCIESLIKKSPPKVCPQCQRDSESNIDDTQTDGEPSLIKRAFPDNATRRDMNRLNVVCYLEGCDWSGLFKDFESHIVNCDFQPLQCSDCHLNLPKYKRLDLQQTVLVSAFQLEEHMRTHRDSTATDTEVKKFVEHLVTSLLSRVQKVEACIIGPTSQWPTTSLPITSRLQIVEAKSSSLQNELKDIKQQTDIILATVKNSTSGLRDKPRTEGAVGGTSPPQKLTSNQDILKAMDSINEKLGIYEGVLTVLNREMEKVFAQSQLDEAERREAKEKIQALERVVKVQEHQLTVKDASMAELEHRMTAAELTSYDGTLVWRIDDFRRRRQDAVSRKIPSFYSPSFYTSKTGYKMCGRIYLNGDGNGRGTHVSCFFTLQRGLYDAMLKWPFRQKVTLIFIDQNNREHVLDSFKPDTTSSSFRRPVSELNVASGCPCFLPLAQLDNDTHAYVKDDVAFIKIVVSAEE